jgi:hypothetical protein
MEDEKIKIEIDERERRSAPIPAERLGSILADFEAALRVYDAVRERLAGAAPPTPLPAGTPPLVSRPPSMRTGAPPSGPPPLASRPPVVRAEIANQARAALAGFTPSRVPSEVRNDPSYLAPGDDLKAAQKALVERRFTALGASNVARSMSVTLSPEEVSRLVSTSTSAAGSVASTGMTGTMELADLMKLIEQRTQGTELYVAGYAPFVELSAKTEAQAIIDRIMKPKGP